MSLTLFWLKLIFLRNRMADAFDQMVWQSCLHGLLQEASMIVCGTKQYYLETSENEGEAMCALWVARTSSR